MAEPFCLVMDRSKLLGRPLNAAVTLLVPGKDSTISAGGVKSQQPVNSLMAWPMGVPAASQVEGCPVG